MHHVLEGYRGFSMILSAQSDRLLSFAVVTAGLVCGAMMGSILLAV